MHRQNLITITTVPRRTAAGRFLRPLDGHRQPALVPRARAGHAARKNLAALLNERRQNLRALVVDEVGFVHAEAANFLFADEAALAALAGHRGRWPPAAALRAGPAVPSTGAEASWAARRRSGMSRRSRWARMELAALGCGRRWRGRFALRLLRWPCCVFFSHSILPANSSDYSSSTECRRIAPRYCRARPWLAGRWRWSCGAGAAPGAVLRGRRAARRSRCLFSLSRRFNSSSTRTVRYLITASETFRRRSSSFTASPWLERSTM